MCDHHWRDYDINDTTAVVKKAEKCDKCKQVRRWYPSVDATKDGSWVYDVLLPQTDASGG